MPIPFVLGGIVFVVIGVLGAIDSKRLDAEGVTVEARITDLRTHEDSEGSRSYSVSFAFQDQATGATHAGSSSISAGFYSRGSIGESITVTYLPTNPSVTRLGAGPFDGASWVIPVLFGGAFAVIGAALVSAIVRARRRAASAPSFAPVEVPKPSLAGAMTQADSITRGRVDQFTRSAGRVVLDTFAPPIAGVAFLAFGVFALTQVASEPQMVLFAGVAGFFGVLLLSAVPVALRRGLGRRIASVGPAGIDHRDFGLLGWPDIRELRIEHNIGSGRRSVAAYERLGIVPSDPSIARSVPGGLARGMIGAFGRFANSQARRAGRRASMTHIADMAPIGVTAYEIEQPFEALIASIRRFAPVVEGQATEPAAVWAPVADPAPDPGLDPGPLTEERIKDLDAGLATRTPASSGAPALATSGEVAASILSITAAIPNTMASPGSGFVATSPPASRPGQARTFVRRGFDAGGLLVNPAGPSPAWALALSILRWAAFTILPFVFMFNAVPLITGGQPVIGMLFLLLPLAFSTVSGHQLLRAIGRWPVVTGEARILTVGADGITARGLGHLGWADIAEVTADNGGTLVIYPGPNAVLTDRTWGDRAAEAYGRMLGPVLLFAPRRGTAPRYELQLGILDADPDEVVDAIATYRIVEEIELPEPD